MPEATPDILSAIMELKGMKRVEQSAVIDAMGGGQVKTVDYYSLLTHILANLAIQKICWCLLSRAWG